MKFWLLSLSFIFLYADIHNILFLIKDIENKKIDIENIDGYNPFCKVNNFYSNKLILKNKSNTLQIKAIFNNKVYINNRWYKKGEKIGEFIIIKITSDAVFFKKNKKIIKVNLYKKLF